LEDEPTIQEVLSEYMKIQNYEVITADNGDDAISFVDRQEFDIAVLDVMVPGADGFEVLAHIHEHKPDMATIMLTALDDEKSQVRAFNLYADDYIIKPVTPLILLKRMETILRRTQIKNREHTQAGEKNQKASGLYLQEEAYQAYYDGEALPLTLSEFLILQLLIREPNRAFTREQIITNIFNDEYIGNDRIIDAHIKNLRKKLPVNCIKTIIGIGYQFDKETNYPF
jgi:DNA-binding response OmpR family regulator